MKDRPNIDLNKDTKSYFYGIDHETLQNMLIFKYESTTKSLFYNNITSPSLNYLVKCLPMCLAPNVLTFMSLILNTICLILMIIDKGNDFSTPSSRWYCLYFGISILIYIILDNLDGKQARRTNSSTTLGLILDHGIDAISASILSIGMSHILSTGSTLKTYVIFFFLNIGFWAIMYEELLLGRMNFGYLSGPDEGLILIVLASVFTFIFYDHYFWSFHAFGDLKVIDLVLIFLAIGGLYTLINSVYNIWKELGKKKVLMFVLNSWLMLLVLLFPLVNYLFLLNSKIFEKNIDLIFYIMSIMCSRILIEILIDITGNRKFNSFCVQVVLTYLSCLIILIVNLFFSDFDGIFRYLYYGVIALTGIWFLHYIIYVVYKISTILEIPLLTVRKNKIQQISLESTNRSLLEENKPQ